MFVSTWESRLGSLGSWEEGCCELWGQTRPPLPLEELVTGGLWPSSLPAPTLKSRYDHWHQGLLILCLSVLSYILGFIKLEKCKTIKSRAPETSHSEVAGHGWASALGPCEREV